MRSAIFGLGKGRIYPAESSTRRSRPTSSFPGCFPPCRGRPCPFANKGYRRCNRPKEATQFGQRITIPLKFVRSFRKPARIPWRWPRFRRDDFTMREIAATNRRRVASETEHPSAPPESELDGMPRSHRWKDRQQAAGANFRMD